MNAEALALSQRFGLDLERTLDVLYGTTAFNGQLKIAWPAKVLKGDSHPVTIDLAHKDLTLIIDAANAAKVPMPVAAAAREAFSAARASGFGGQDFSAMVDALCEGGRHRETTPEELMAAHRPRGEWPWSLLTGKVAVITGAARASAGPAPNCFLKDGAKVVIADIDSAGLAKTASEIGGRDDLRAVEADVTNRSDVERLVATAAETFGRLDIMVNNAGIARKRTSSTHRA